MSEEDLKLGESPGMDKAIIWWSNLKSSDKNRLFKLYEKNISERYAYLPDISIHCVVSYIYEREILGKPKCDKGRHGACCCNCKNQLVVTKHPWNKSRRFKGAASELTGLYVCKAFNDMDKNEFRASSFENKHGSCELHEYKK